MKQTHIAVAPEVKSLFRTAKRKLQVVQDRDLTDSEALDELIRQAGFEGPGNAG